MILLLGPVGLGLVGWGWAFPGVVPTPNVQVKSEEARRSQKDPLVYSTSPSSMYELSVNLSPIAILFIFKIIVVSSMLIISTENCLGSPNPSGIRGISDYGVSRMWRRHDPPPGLRTV